MAAPELTSLRGWLPVPGDFFVGALEKIGKHFEKIGNNLKKLESTLVGGQATIEQGVSTT